MRAHATASPDDIDILSLWGALRRSLPKLIVASALVGGATFGILSLVTPRYTSEAQLSVVAKGVANPFGDPKKDTQPSDNATVRMDKEAVNTHVRALSSSDLALKIVDDLQLSTMKEFNGALGPMDPVGRVMRLVGIGVPRKGETEEDRVLNAFIKQLEVYSPKESRFIGVRFTASKPELAAEVANGLAEAYRTKLAGQVNDDYDRVRADLEPKIAALTADLSTAETEVEMLRGKVGNLRIGSDTQGQSTGIRERELSDVNQELTKAKAQRSEAEARARSAREMMKAGSADALPDVQKSPLIQNLVQQRVRLERQVSELSASLLPGHPRMQQLNADLGGLKKQLAGEIGKVVDSLEKEVKVTAFREEALQKSLDKLKSQIITVSTSPDEAKLRQAEANAKSKKSEMERLQAQFEAARARHGSAAVPVEVQIIQPARASSVPTFPKKGPYAGLLAVATLLFGTALVVSKALFMGARSGGSVPAPVTSRAQPASLRSEPSLVAEPSERAVKPASVAKVVAGAPVAAGVATSAAAVVGQMASVEEMAAHIGVKGGGNGGYRTMIAGERDSVEVASEAIELAKGMAGSGRQVVLIDWSMSGKGLAAAAGVGKAAGIGDLLAGAASFEDVVRRLPGSDVHLIAAGLPVAEADIDAEQINLVLDALDEAYDHIVVAGRYEDARVLFEAIQGRFDCGVIVADRKPSTAVIADPPGTFLGYEVAEIEVLRLNPAVGRSNAAQQRLMRVSSRGGAAAAPSV